MWWYHLTSQSKPSINTCIILLRRVNNGLINHHSYDPRTFLSFVFFASSCVYLKNPKRRVVVNELRKYSIYDKGSVRKYKWIHCFFSINACVILICLHDRAWYYINISVLTIICERCEWVIRGGGSARGCWFLLLLLSWISYTHVYWLYSTHFVHIFYDFTEFKMCVEWANRCMK